MLNDRSKKRYLVLDKENYNIRYPRSNLNRGIFKSFFSEMASTDEIQKLLIANNSVIRADFKTDITDANDKLKNELKMRRQKCYHQ